MQQASTELRQRFNTLGIAALGLVGVVILAVSLGAWLHNPAGVVEGNLQPAAGGSTDYEFRLSHDALALAGTRERLFVLERWKTDPPSGASVNFLIVDSGDATSRWMFPDNGQTILTRNELHTAYGVDAETPVAGLVLTVRQDAANGTMRQSLYYYRVGGGPAVRFLTADRIIAAQQVAPDRYLAIYRNGTKATVEIFSMVDFSAIAQKALPDIPQ